MKLHKRVLVSSPRAERKSLRYSGLLGVSLVLAGNIVGTPRTFSADVAKPLNVVVLSSANFLVPASVVQDQALRETIVAGSDRKIVFFPETTDTMRLDGEKYEPEYAAFLQKKYQNIKVDLVMPMGAYALDFVKRRRSEIWPEAPVVFYSVSEAQIRNQNFGANFTGQTMTFDFRGTIDLALRFHPDTRQIAVVGGVAAFDRNWMPIVAAELRRYPKIAPLWLTNQTVPQLIEEAGRLPDDTVMFFTSISRDPSGQTYVSQEAFAMVAKASSVPIYSPGEPYLGLGLVGGSITSFAEQGRNAGKLALRVLRGEKPETIPIQPTPSSQLFIDWRQVRRWNIDQSLVPADAVMRFRVPTFWENYRKIILLSLCIGSAQTILITALLIGRSRRLKFQKELSQRLNFERLVAELSAEFINLPSDQVDAAVERALKRVLSVMRLDRCSLFKYSPTSAGKRITHSVRSSDDVPEPPPVGDLSWLWKQLQGRQTVIVSDVTRDLPSEAANERSYAESLGSKAFLVIPVSLAKETVLGVSCHSRRVRQWRPSQIVRLQVLGEILISALTRKAAEESLRASEERYREVVETQTDLVCRYRPDTTLTFVNEAYCRFFGRTREELIGWKFLDLVPPNSWEMIMRNIESMTKERTVLTHEHEVILHDGSIGWHQWVNHVIVDAKGGILEYQAIGRDITERKQAELRMRESEERFVHMANSAPVLIWASALNKQCIFFNKPWLDFTGRSLEQELGNGWVEGVLPEDREKCMQSYVEAFDARRPFTVEYRLRRHDGEYRWILDHGVPRLDAKKNFLGFIGSCVDVSERRRADEKFRLAVESSPNGIILTDDQNRIILVNAQIEKLFGYTREELIGQNAGVLVPLFQSCRERKNSSVPQHATRGEVVGQRKNASGFPVEVSINPIQTDEGVLALAAIVDLTARKQAEADAEQQRMELAHVARVSTMGALAGSLAHELNQPLSAILSNAQAGSRFLAQDDPDMMEIRSVLQDIAHDTKRAGEVIRQMRALVKKDEPNFESLEVNRVIHDVVRLLNSDILIRKVRVVLELNPDVHQVHGDSVQIQQVVLNLLLNAFDAMREMPEAERLAVVRTRQLNPTSVQVEVRDKGVGIRPEKLAKLFEPFQSSKREGLGLGLSISRSIIEAHRGEIRGENNVDQGSTFYFSLPVHEYESKRVPSFAGEMPRPVPAK